MLSSGFALNKNIENSGISNHYRKSIINDITSRKTIVEKFLQLWFRLSSFISRYLWILARNIILYLLGHGQMVKPLNTCLKTKTLEPLKVLVSVSRTCPNPQQAFLKMLMEHYNSCKTSFWKWREQLYWKMEPFTLQVQSVEWHYGELQPLCINHFK